MDELSSFARLLSRLRHQRGLTQAGLAQQTSCGIDTIKELETDARRLSRQMAARLADYFALCGPERAEFLQAARNSSARNVGRAGGALAPAHSAQAKLNATTSALPLQSTSFIGRENEIHTLTGLLTQADCRLVTLLGPGGIGKSRLAIQVARRLGEPLRAVGLLVSIVRDPASDHETCDQAHTLLARCETLLGPAEFAAASHGRQEIELPALFDALRMASGDGTLPAGAALRPASRPASPPKAQRRQPLVEPLTEREFSVLRLIADGCSNREIAAQFVITPGSAKWYVSQIFGKLGVHSRTQAIVRAQELGYLA